MDNVTLHITCYDAQNDFTNEYNREYTSMVDFINDYGDDFDLLYGKENWSVNEVK